MTNLARTMKQLQSRGIWIFGTSDKGDRGLYETDFTGPAALVMGAEGEGSEKIDGRELRFPAEDSHEGKHSVPERICGYGRMPV